MIDLLALAYIGFGVYRGRRCGLPVVLPSLVSWLVFFVTGCGLYKWTGRALFAAGRVTGVSLGVIGFLAVIVATYLFIRRFRIKIRDWAKQHFDAEQQKTTGGIAGGVRAFLLVALVLMVIAHAPLRFVPEGSLLGRGLIRFVLPVYDQTHN